ncbi:hypothetical protein [Labedaea rhizosphaerae]
MRNIENRNDPIALIKLHRIARELGVVVDEIMAAGPVPSAPKTNHSAGLPS